MAVAAAFALALALLLLGLGNSTLWSRDETTYAVISRAMLTSGDWVTLHFNGRPWLNHPPFFFWLMAADFHLLGINEIAARLPAVVFGAAGVALIVAMGGDLVGRWGAVAAALALLLNPLYFVESRMAIIDSTFLFFLTLTMLAFHRGWLGDGKAWRLFFVSLGLSCLVKGPWGLVYPMAIIIAFTALGRETRRLREIPWGWGMPVALVIGGAWYATQLALHGAAFAQTVLGYYFIGRITTQVEHQGGPFWLYLAVLSAGFLPWSPLLPPALRALWERRATDARARLIICWLGAPLIGLSLASTKLPSYTLLILPPCALAVGGWCARIGERQSLVVPFGLASAASLCLSALVAFKGEAWTAAPLPALHAASAAFLLQGIALGAAVGAAARPGTSAVPVMLSALGAGLFLITVTMGLLPALEPIRSLREVAMALRVASRPTDRRAFYGPGVFGIVFYGDDGPYEELRHEDSLRAWISRGADGVMVTRTDALSHLPAEVRAHLETVAQTQRETILRVR